MPAFSLGKRTPWRSVTARLSSPADEPEIRAQEEPHRGPEDLVPPALKVAAGWSWRLLVVFAVAGVLFYLGVQLKEVVIPLMAAGLLCAALYPLKHTFDKVHWPGWLSSLVPMLVLALVIGGLLTLVGTQIGTQWSALSQQAITGFASLMTWLANGPLHISQSQMNAWVEQARAQLSARQAAIASGVAQLGTSVNHFMTGLLMALFATFFFLKDGARLNRALLSGIPAGARGVIEPGVHNGWRSLVSYVRAAVIVAAADGIGAGLGALILGSNLWLAITALTFVCAFVPLIGSLTAGSVAVVVTLVTLGWVKAAIMLVVFVGVMSLESHILQPLLLGRAVSLHPLTVLLGIAVGLIVAGIPGGVFAIPLVAFASGLWRGVHPEQEDESGSAVDDKPSAPNEPSASTAVVSNGAPSTTSAPNVPAPTELAPNALLLNEPSPPAPTSDASASDELYH